MRILFDARAVRGQSDGLNNYVRHIVSNLIQVDAENEYVVLLGSAFHHHLSNASLLNRSNIHAVTTSIPFMGLRQQLLVPSLVRRLPPATVYHYPHFDMPLSAHPCSIVTIYDLNHISFDAYFRSQKHLKQFYAFWSTWLTVSKAKHIITISNTTKAQLLKRFRWLNPGKVSVIYFGLNDTFQHVPRPEMIEAFRRKFHLGNDRFILYVGTNRAHKNVHRAIAAFSLLRSRSNFTHKLLLVGSAGGDEQFRRMLKTQGFDEFVVPLGYVSDEELPLAYRVADALVYCSLSEGFGMPLLEAMASEVPIVTSHLGATAEVVGDSAILVDPFSVDAIANGLSRVLSSDTLRRELIDRGLTRVKSFSWEEAARKTLEVYTKVREEYATSQ